MANNKKVKRGFYELLSNTQATMARIIKSKIVTATATATTTTIGENANTSQSEVKCKTRSRCNMKNNKNEKTNSNNNCCSNKASDTSSRFRFNSSISGNSSCSKSLSLFHLSSFRPNSIITFITTTICGGGGDMQNVHNLYWESTQQRQQQQQRQRQLEQQQQYKIKTKTFSSASPPSKFFASTTTTRTSSLKNSNIFASLKLYFFLWLILSLLAPCVSLTMTEVRIPKHIMRYETAALGCKYDLDGESLYSVKWYKDGFEFYRYVPRDMPPGQVFPLPGVDVDLQNSTDNVVVLNRVILQSTGRYRCEVSGEAPSFQTVSGHEDMIVVVTPLKGPQITGGQPRYSIGEKVSVNCTSAPSKPICHLSWLINGVHANRSYLRYYEPKIVGREGLEVATLGLEFRVRG